jgi:hypothetical protein
VSLPFNKDRVLQIVDCPDTTFRVCSFLKERQATVLHIFACLYRKITAFNGWDCGLTCSTHTKLKIHA